MTPQEAIKTIKVAISEVEWDYPMDYTIAFEEAITALKKQIPKKSVNYDSVPHNRCPVCNNAVKVFEDAHEHHYCLYCGQRINWSTLER